eukprot:6178386-Pleurochrysis_carterae.AAC.3
MDCMHASLIKSALHRRAAVLRCGASAFTIWPSRHRRYTLRHPALALSPDERNNISNLALAN